ncbi:MAG TPA: (2Fe-2S)-binding protein [Desulfobacteraceae bacterium]|nr:(2Fe-2S)-binding protein [Desulfobacteraceae bacterium]
MSKGLEAIRITDGIERGKPVTIQVNGERISSFAGESLATALIASGRWVFQTHKGRPMGVFCNIGICHSCLVEVDGVTERACQIEVKDGMIVKTRQFDDSL